MTDVNQVFGENELLLTGANGFLGKVVLGLLLDRYAQFKHLHLLLRPGAHLSASDRFYDETLNSPALAAITAQRGEDFLRTKISIWSGDIGAPDCGLSEGVVEDLAGRVKLILNCAGRVDFFPPLDDSLRSNVDGVENTAALARQLGAKLLHISTCFVCGEADGLIEETEPIGGYYPHRRGPEDHRFDPHEELRHGREMVRQIYESDASACSTDRNRRSRELTRRLIALGRQRAANWGWVNTYTYAKSLGEQLLVANSKLDCCILRPAIVESAWRFPFPGWIEGGRTAAPLVLMALGGLKDWPVNEDAPLEVVPVDMAAAAILAVAALVLEGHHKPVYQLGSADINPIELGSVVELLDREARRRVQKNGGSTPGRFLLDWLVGTRASARARFVSARDAQDRRLKLRKDIARAQRWMTGMTGTLEKTGLPGKHWFEAWSGELRKLDLQANFREQTLDQYLPFVLQNRYIFESENIRLAYSTLSDMDRNLLPWCPEKINWKDYWVHSQIAGIEKWVQPEAVREWAFKI